MTMMEGLRPVSQVNPHEVRTGIESVDHRGVQQPIGLGDEISWEPDVDEVHDIGQVDRTGPSEIVPPDDPVERDDAIPVAGEVEQPNYSEAAPAPVFSSEMWDAYPGSVRSQPAAPVAPDLVERITAAVAKAAAVGEDYTALRTAVEASVRDATDLKMAFDQVEHNAADGLVNLRYALSRCEIDGAAPIVTELKPLEGRIERGCGEPLGVDTDPRGLIHMDWGDAEPADGADGGRLVFVGVEGGQAGEDNEQVNVFVHVIDDPRIDFRAQLRAPGIREMLGDLSARPQDLQLRQAVHDALSRNTTRPAADWTRSFTSGGSATFGRCAQQLNGTVAVFESRCVQIGDQNYQENTIVQTVSPKIDGAALLADSAVLVNALLDLACSPDDQGATHRFADALDTTLTTSLAQSRAGTVGRGTIYRPPGAGRTLTIRNVTGVSVGRRVSQKNHHLHEANLGRQSGRGVRQVSAAAQRAARARG